MTTPTHSPRCIESALGAIAENNAVTIHYNLAAASDLTPETEAEALEWIGNGNALCQHYDGCPTCPGCDLCV